MIKTVACLSLLVSILSICVIYVPGEYAQANSVDLSKTVQWSYCMNAAGSSGSSDDRMAVENSLIYWDDHYMQDFYSHFASASGAFGRERDQENRNKVTAYLLDPANVGSTLAEMAENLSMNPGTLDYYLCEFEYNYLSRSNATCYDPGCRNLLFTADGKEHRFVRLQGGKYTRIWPGDLRDKNSTRALIIHLRDPVRKQILETIVDQPGVTNILLSKAFDRNKSTMHHHLKQLQDADLISMEQNGRAKLCFASDVVQSTICELRSA